MINFFKGFVGLQDLMMELNAARNRTSNGIGLCSLCLRWLALPCRHCIK